MAVTRAGRLFRNLLERLLSKYYEGPEPPRRFGEEVQLFQVVYPMASAEEWAGFAQRLAEKAYRDGFVRGYEWNERDWEGPPDTPERLLELEAHNWSIATQNPDLERALASGYDPNDPLAGLTPEERVEFYERFGALRDHATVFVRGSRE